MMQVWLQRHAIAKASKLLVPYIFPGERNRLAAAIPAAEPADELSAVKREQAQRELSVWPLQVTVFGQCPQPADLAAHVQILHSSHIWCAGR